MTLSEKHKTYTVHDRPESERPRERLQRLGAENVSSQELLAVIMSSGTRGVSVIDLAQKVLEKYSDLPGLAAASVDELCQITGIKLAKACRLKAAFELANRINLNKSIDYKALIKCPEDAYQQINIKARGKKKEYFWGMFLDIRNRIIRISEVSVGSLDSSIVHPREVFKEAISASAASLIAAHNHPSGNPEPSKDDISLTKRLKEAGELVGIELADHIIIGDGRYVSLKREGLL
jgi:DNA repair protein RadC